MPRNIVFQSDPRERVIKVDVVEQTKTTQTMCWISSGLFQCGVAIMEGQNVVGLWKVQLKAKDIIAAYRTFRLLDAAASVSEQLVTSVQVPPRMNDFVHDSGWRECIADVKTAVGQNYDSILQEVPRALELAINKAEQWMDLDLTSVTDEVVAGRIEYSGALEEIGVEHPRKRKERAARKETILGQARPHLVSFLDVLPQQIKGAFNVQRLDEYVLAIYRRGVEEVDLQVGLALFLEQADSPGRALHGLFDFGNLLQRFDPLSSAEPNILAIAFFLTNEFRDREGGPRKPREYLDLLCNKHAEIQHPRKINNDA
jgi:hypothetical protein